ncbi:unnamed protein product [Lactuca saligna]|uniref:Reverse transcriptase zinc-binding domain-containing protein n=1 Tax=Lactuca saligna TaxID=75948 RepID=A0AA36ED79_LACSI|nr:unnamed protein product [Lactuca saligna]
MSPLSIRFPNLFKLEKRNSACISERRSSYDFAADWKRALSSPVEIVELDELKDIINSFSFSNAKDSWKGSLAPDDVFKVNILRDQIDSVITEVSIKRMEWNSMVSIKVGININSTVCSMCSSQEETVDHLLVDCMFAHDTFKWISKWCQLDIHRFSIVADVISFASQWGNCPKKRKILISIVYDVLWCIWLARITGYSVKFLQNLQQRRNMR